MTLDVSIVLFRSPPEMVSALLADLLLDTSAVRRLWILRSGGSTGLDAVLESYVEAFAKRDNVRMVIESRPDNLGFAGGHNLLVDSAFESGALRVLLLNPDLRLKPGALRAFAAAVSQCEHQFGIDGPVLQSLARGGDPTLPPSSRTLDSTGIRWSVDGRHFDDGQGRKVGRLDGSLVSETGVSGAALSVDATSYERLTRLTGRFLDPLFLAYREDAELGVRVKTLGGDCRIYHLDGFFHVRGARNAERTSSLQRLLSVRNRFFLRWCLGTFRPGRFGLPTLRDCLVIVGVLVRERSSVEGLRAAWRLRRTMLYRGRRLRCVSGGD